MQTKIRFCGNNVAALILPFSSIFTLGKLCDKPLLENTQIFPNQVFSGKGGRSQYHLARFANDGWCAWSSIYNYLSLDLQKEYHITQVVVMGNKDQTRWSKSYVMRYGHDITYQNSIKVIMLCNKILSYRKNVTIRPVTLISETCILRTDA